MKNKPLSKPFLIVAACIMLISAFIVVFQNYVGSKPFGDLAAANIKSATVTLSPPGKTIAIPEFEELASYLNDVVIYSEDNSYTGYAGQKTTFTLMMTDGTQTDVTACNPFLVIDGVGYKTKYEPCEALNTYGNKLLQEIYRLMTAI